MEKEKKKRKKRSDRYHLIYKITCLVTNEKYLGMTGLEERAFLRSIKNRLKEHFSCAKNGRAGKLYDCIRFYGEDCFVIEEIERVRGRQLAHKREAELIRTKEFVLNSTVIIKTPGMLITDPSKFQKLLEDKRCG